MTDLLRAIARLHFKPARTMPELPHEYTLRREAADEADFLLLFEAIQRDGVIERWKGWPGRYLYPGDGWRYWPMTAKLAPKVEFNRHINRNTLEEAQKLRDAGIIT